MKLSELKNGTTAVITGVNGDSSTLKKLVTMGFVKEREITAIKNAPLNDPIEYELMGYNISLRRSEAEQVEVVLKEEYKCHTGCSSPFCPKEVARAPKRNGNEGNRQINIALVGNPNSGKTTLFNSLAGRNEHTGNYAGVTVELKMAKITHKGYEINITDLPGIYSLSNAVAEEKVVSEVLYNNNFDYVINVVDATMLERNLYLTTQLMDMAAHVVVALNMYDELVSIGDKFDYETLSSMLDIPFVPTVATKGEGAIAILDSIITKHEQKETHTHVQSNFGTTIEEALSNISSGIKDESLGENTTKRFMALSLLEGDKTYAPIVDAATLHNTSEQRTKIEKEYGEPITQILANARYGYIDGALRETLTVKKNRLKRTTSIDNILTHKIWGLPIFIGVVWAMFYAVFTLGAPLQDLIDYGVGSLSEGLNSVMTDSAFKDLVIDGIIGGVGSVIIFLPNILILFLIISILEDSGYLARTAFIMDKLMHKIGLHGKSFIPLLMGFGCNVPAIMATRIIDDPKNRLVTMLILPFMSCSARMPVYILLIGAFFPEYGSVALLGIYLLGIIIAILTALILRKFFIRGKDQPFVMELPPYRIPTVGTTVKHMWQKGGQYLKKMGGIILISSMIIWALSYYPTREDSYIKDIGHAIEPAIEPLGFDWKIGVALVSGVAAKEIVVGTMGVLNNVDGEDEEGLTRQLQSATSSSGDKLYTTATTLSLLAFVLIYFPCIGVVAAIKRESGRWKWAAFSILYTTGVAWIVSFAVYNLFK